MENVEHSYTNTIESKHQEKTKEGEQVVNACRMKQWDKIHGFIKLGYPVNESHGAQQHTPLHLAAMDAQADICRVLIEKGVNLNAKTKLLETPLHFAVPTRCLDTIRVLVEAGANIYSKDKNEKEPFDGASWTDVVYPILVLPLQLSISKENFENNLEEEQIRESTKQIQRYEEELCLQQERQSQYQTILYQLHDIEQSDKDLEINELSKKISQFHISKRLLKKQINQFIQLKIEADELQVCYSKDIIRDQQEIDRLQQENKTIQQHMIDLNESNNNIAERVLERCEMIECIRLFFHKENLLTQGIESLAIIMTHSEYHICFLNNGLAGLVHDAMKEYPLNASIYKACCLIIQLTVQRNSEFWIDITIENILKFFIHATDEFKRIEEVITQVVLCFQKLLDLLNQHSPQHTFLLSRTEIFRIQQIAIEYSQNKSIKEAIESIIKTNRNKETQSTK